VTGRPSTAVRLVRTAVACVLLVVLCSGPALAAGTGGIEVTPVPAAVDGKQATSFRVEVPARGTEQVPFTLRNVEDGERSARIYTAAVSRAADGTLSLDEPGSSEYVELPEQEVTLQAGEVRQESFTVSAGDIDGDQLAAVVVEVRNGAVVQRASTLIHLDKGRQVPLPLLLLVVAVLLVVAGGVGVAAASRRRAGS